MPAFEAAMDDDFNTAGALACAVRAGARDQYRARCRGGRRAVRRAQAEFRTLAGVLGLRLADARGRRASRWRRLSICCSRSAPTCARPSSGRWPTRCGIELKDLGVIVEDSAPGQHLAHGRVRAGAMELLYGRHAVLESACVPAGAKCTGLSGAGCAGARGNRGRDHQRWPSSDGLSRWPRPRREHASPRPDRSTIRAWWPRPGPIRTSMLDDVLPGSAAVERERPLYLALDHLQDVQNLGTLLRTAEAMAVTGVLLPDRRAAEITPAVVNASAGAVEHLRIALVGNLVQALED